MKAFHFVIFAVLLSAALAAESSDEIKSLPGLKEKINFKQYAGYVAIPGTSKKLFYWFVESQRDPANDPVVLWMNGGPGCSSLDGFLEEHGPFHVHKDGSLYVNKYAWNRIANVIYLEAPAGVGFSYSDDPNEFETDDHTTAHDNNLFLRGFFTKYPQFQKNDFYISGESYGGIYVPMATFAVHQANEAGVKPFVNLKGYLVGNPFTDVKIDGIASIDFLNSHALITDQSYKSIQVACRDNYENMTKHCNDTINHALDRIGCVNTYYTTGPCLGDGSNGLNKSKTLTVAEAKERAIMRRTNPVWNVYYGSKLDAQDDFNHTARFQDILCLDATHVGRWLNSPATRKALHAKPGRIWKFCTGEITYHSVVKSTVPYHKALIDLGYRALAYSGDVDASVPFVGTQRWVDSMGYTLLGDRSWYYTHPEFGVQVGGHVKYYEGITFVTVRGAGHMVPQEMIGRPQTAFHLFESYLEQKDL